MTNSRNSIASESRIGNHRLLPFLMLFAGFTLCVEIGFGVNNGQGLKWDFANFYDAGHKVIAGETHNLYDPSAPIEGKPAQGQTPFYGTPLSAVLYAPLAWFPPHVALLLFKIQGTLANLAGIVLLYWKQKRFGEVLFGNKALFLALFITVVAVYQPFWRIYHIGGQTTPTVFLALVLAFLWHVKGRYFLAAFCVALAVVIKPAFVIALVLLALLSGRKFMTYAAGIGLILATTSIALMGWPVHEAFLKRS
jgi:hypothetical protein